MRLFHMKNSTRVPAFIRKRIWEVLLVVLCIVLIVSHTLYVIQTHQFPQGGLDEPVYLESALSMYDLLKSDPIGNWQKILSVTINRQPFYPLFIALPLLIFGTDYLYKIGMWINIIFYIITIISIYTLGRRFLSMRASFLASYIFAFYGFPLFYLHFTYSETAVTAFITAALSCLAWSNGLTNSKSVIGFALLFAGSSLVRWVAPLFIIGPFLTEIVSHMFEQRTHISQYVKRLFIGISLCIVFGLIPMLLLHYLPQREYLFGYIYSNTSNSSVWAEQHLGIPSIQSVFSTRSVMFYLNIFSQQGIYFWILFVVGFMVSLRFIRTYIFLLSGFVVPYAIFTFGSAWKGDRFILPIYPFMALVSAVVFDHIPSSFVRKALILLTIIVGFLNLLGASWGVGPLGHQGLKDVVLPEFIHHPRRIYLTTIVWPPRENEANIYLIDALIRKDWKNLHKPPVIALGFFLPQMENGLGEVWGRERRGTASIVFLYNIHKDQEELFWENVVKADYIFIKDGSITGKNNDVISTLIDDEYYYTRLLRVAYQNNGNQLPYGYQDIGKIYIPIDKSTMRVFKKVKNVTKNDWQIFLHTRTSQ